MDQQKELVNNLLEEGWFFGNTLKSRSKSSKFMVRCNSDPCPSSGSTEEDHDNPTKITSGLFRAPSLPVSLGQDKKYGLLEEEDDDDDDDDDEPRMGDLIRQAMPMTMPSRRLDRSPSLPPCRGTSEASSNALNGSGRITRVSVDSSPLLQEKGPIGMVKLSRRASIDSSIVLPPKYTSKGTKQCGSNPKNGTLRKPEQSNLNTSTKIEKSKIQTQEKSKPKKSSSDLETEELQGFKDLGLSFHNEVSPNVTQKLPTLQRRASLDTTRAEVSKVRRPHLLEDWQKPSSPLSTPPAVPKWGDQKASSTQDMKTQIKFWARAVASNVRQEC